MRHSRALSQGVAACSVAVLAAALAGPAGADSQQGSSKTAPDSYLVLTSQAAAAESVAAKLRAQGAKVTSVNQDVGMVVAPPPTPVSASRPPTSRACRASRPSASSGTHRCATISVEQENLRAAQGRDQGHQPRPGHQGGRRQGSQGLEGRPPRRQPLGHADDQRRPGAHPHPGQRQVKVGIMDTGVQADHPDLHANFDYRASRNFVTDIPTTRGQRVDGPCESPKLRRPGRHGRRWARHARRRHHRGRAERLRSQRCRPEGRIVEVRAGQDSGYFFAGPTVNALTYSGDAGLDVVNMSFYVDPWLYNCQGGAPRTPRSRRPTRTSSSRRCSVR